MHCSVWAPPCLPAHRAGEADAACDALPNVAWWNKTHKQIITYVDRRHDGDWESYVNKWSGYQERMQKTLDDKGSATVRSRGLKLEGEVLANHVEDIKKRVSVIKCLAEAADAGDASAAANFETAAGGDNPNSAAGGRPGIGQQFAGIQPRQPVTNFRSLGGKFSFEVSARCDERGAARFEIVNRGEKWPQMASISVYRFSDLGIVSKRVLRMTADQRTSFVVPREEVPDREVMGLWVQPSWKLRDFKLDAVIACS